LKREKVLEGKASFDLYAQIKELHNELDDAFIKQFDRSLPLNEELFDRWDRAKKLNFGEGSSIYDSSLVFGKVKVGVNCWIGPNTIIDGSGGLHIGNYCTISAGAQIYSHDNVKQTLSSGLAEIERTPVSIGDNVYIGSNATIIKGVRVGNFCVIGAYSFINKDVPNNSIVFGQPGKVMGTVIINDDGINFQYFNESQI
jgi:acetyltransferase-like isoleucine patch superfamily enzyme